MSRLDDLIRSRTERRRKVASACVAEVLDTARRSGIDMVVIGSMATGRFADHSDVDFLVHGAISPERRAVVERIVADRLRGTGIPYDLIFAGDLKPEQVKEFLDAIVQTPCIREALAQDRPG